MCVCLFVCVFVCFFLMVIFFIFSVFLIANDSVCTHINSSETDGKRFFGRGGRVLTTSQRRFLSFPGELEHGRGLKQQYRPERFGECPSVNKSMYVCV